MNTYQTAVESGDALRLRAVKQYRNEVRFRAIVQAVVAQAIRRHGPIDPHEAERAACDIATEAAAVLLETIFNEDAELMNMREQVKIYKKMAEDALHLSPMPMLLTTPKSGA